MRCMLGKGVEFKKGMLPAHCSQCGGWHIVRIASAEKLSKIEKLTVRSLSIELEELRKTLKEAEKRKSKENSNDRKILFK